MNKDELKHLAVIVVWGLALICMCLVSIFAITSLPGCGQKSVESESKPVANVEKPVCIVDTGVDFRHPFLKGKVKRAINYSDSVGPSLDVHGHGTHVAGLAVKAGAKELLSCKALNNRGRGNCSRTAKCVDWCVDRGAGVINLSLGRPRPCSFTAKAIDKAVKRGVIVVASAGNRGKKSGLCSYPGKLETTINVGSGTRAKPHSFSSTKCVVKAYENGRNQRSTLPADRWGRKSGTSMAAPKCSAKKSRGEKCGEEI